MSDYGLGPKIVRDSLYERTLLITTEKVIWLCTPHKPNFYPDDRFFNNKSLDIVYIDYEELSDNIYGLVHRLHSLEFGHGNLTGFAIGSTIGSNKRIVLGCPEYIYPLYGCLSNPLVEKSFMHLHGLDLSMFKIIDLQEFDYNRWYLEYENYA
jgi:hypothetical protein